MLRYLIIYFLTLSNINVTPVFGKEGKCTKCVDMRDEIAKARIDDIKSTILKQLNLDAPPVVHVPLKMKPAIEKITRLVENEAHSDGLFIDYEESKGKVETIVFGEDSNDRYHGRPLVLFNLASDLQSKEVVSANLKIQLRHLAYRVSEKHADEIHIHVREIQNDKEGTEIAYGKLYAHRARDFAGIKLDVNDVQRWILDGSPVLLDIQAKYLGENLVVMPNGNDAVTIFLEITTIDRSARKKRETNFDICEPNMRIKSCCRYDLTLDFQQTGWDFVQFPPSYNAYMCLGECEPKHPSRNGYGILAATYNESIVSCCHPGEYEDLDVTYFSEENVLKRTRIPNLIAKTCVCG